MPELNWQSPLSISASHRVWWTHDALSNNGDFWREVLAGLEGHCLAFVDSGVAAAWPNLPQRLHELFQKSGASLHLHAIESMPGGEMCKDGLQHAERVARACFEHGVSRRGCVIAIGGGAVLDTVGFGAAMAHRGVPVIRVATSTLSQGDSAMGVKCGVNQFGHKNALGTFCAPHAVICCERLLSTLPFEHWLGGFSEAVKIALLKDESLFSDIESAAPALVARNMDAARPILRRSGQLHRDHILKSGDPFEQGSSRPLDHGHWAAHRLEALSHWQLPHGQAVAIGMALDSCIAAHLGLCSEQHCNRLLHLLQSVGLPCWNPLLNPLSRLHEGLEHFRQHLGGQLALALVTAPGAFVEVNDLSLPALQAAVNRLEAMQRQTTGRHDGT